MTDNQIAECHQGVLLDEAQIDAIQDVVRATYRETLAPSDLADPGFSEECRKARNCLLEILELTELAE